MCSCLALKHPHLSQPPMHIQCISALNAPPINCLGNLIMLPPVVTNYMSSSSNDSAGLDLYFQNTKQLQINKPAWTSMDQHCQVGSMLKIAVTTGAAHILFWWRWYSSIWVWYVWNELHVGQDGIGDERKFVWEISYIDLMVLYFVTPDLHENNTYW